MASTVNINDMADVIMRGLTEYAELATDDMKEAVKNELENKELYEVKLPIELPISKINLIYIKEQLTQSDKKFIKNYLKN